ncbi:MAG: MBL fold metallo-hydrolase, partial [Selenomonadaceae bacterium]|nr:MBL fold metallo-hydrolase [Selenomonadaceae bacterium]
IASTKIFNRSLVVGDELDFGGGVKFKVLWPTKNFVAEMNAGKSADKKNREYKLNNSSVVGRLTYKNFSMMFTGDCEKESEAKILASNSPEDLKCDVLKSGHHGTTTSSTKEFVAAVNPGVVLISATGLLNNDIRLSPPSLQALQTYLAAGVDAKNIFSTHANGTITVTTDGKNFSVTPEIKTDWLDAWMIEKKSVNGK